MDEIAAKRFEHSANSPSPADTPSANEVLNAALKEVAANGLTEVIVILHDADSSRTICMNNIWECIRVVGLLETSIHHHMRLSQ